MLNDAHADKTYIIASLKHAGTSTTQDQLSISFFFVHTPWKNFNFSDINLYLGELNNYAVFAHNF